MHIKAFAWQCLLVALGILAQNTTGVWGDQLGSACPFAVCESLTVSYGLHLAWGASHNKGPADGRNDFPMSGCPVSGCIHQSSMHQASQRHLKAA